MNLTTPGGVPYGDIVLNAQRTGETSGDIAIDAAGSLTIKGTYGIALNAFWTYDLPGSSTSPIRRRSTATIPRALPLSMRRSAMRDWLRGRPRVLRASQVTVKPSTCGRASRSPRRRSVDLGGDIDLAGYRYGYRRRS